MSKKSKDAPKEVTFPLAWASNQTKAAEVRKACATAGLPMVGDGELGYIIKEPGFAPDFATGIKGEAIVVVVDHRTGRVHLREAQQ